MTNEDTVNVYDWVIGTDVDVPDHPANTLTAEKIRQRHEDATHNDVVGDPLDYPERYDYGMGDELPVLIESDMRADPCEGVQGTYTEIVERECDVCGYDRADHSAHTLAGVHTVECRACGNVIERA